LAQVGPQRPAAATHLQDLLAHNASVLMATDNVSQCAEFIKEDTTCSVVANRIPATRFTLAKHLMLHCLHGTV
jgi:hypothetical protein